LWKSVVICHENKFIFIHIPKCAGSSIETFFGAKPFDWRTPDYDHLTGWCPERKIHLQHATARQLRELGLVSGQAWEEYFKFTIVRNPWARALSDYLWLQRNRGIRDSFLKFIRGEGAYSEALSRSGVPGYRGDHLVSQYDYTHIDGSLALDFVGRFENLAEDFSRICRTLGRDSQALPHKKKGRREFEHYSHFYSARRRRVVAETYRNDIAAFNYAFEDRKKQLPWNKRLAIELASLRD